MSYNKIRLAEYDGLHCDEGKYTELFIHSVSFFHLFNRFLGGNYSRIEFTCYPKGQWKATVKMSFLLTEGDMGKLQEVYSLAFGSPFSDISEITKLTGHYILAHVVRRRLGRSKSFLNVDEVNKHLGKRETTLEYLESLGEDGKDLIRFISAKPVSE